MVIKVQPIQYWQQKKGLNSMHLRVEQHNDKLSDLLSQEPEIPNNPTASEALSYRMATKAGKAFYALRKTKIEPTFGIIKNVMGFRCFSLKGLESVTGEWNLVCIAYTLKRLCSLSFKMS